MKILGSMFLLLAIGSPLAATVKGPLARLVEASEVVAVGTLSNASISGNRVIGVLMIERSLTINQEIGGSVPVMAELRGRVFAPGASLPPLRGVWFLTRSDEHGWRILPGSNSLPARYYPAATTLGAFEYAENAPLNDKVVLELCAALETVADDSRQFGMLGIAFRGIGGLASPTIRLAFERLADSDRPPVAAIGIGALIGLEAHAEILEQVEASLETLAPTAGFHVVVSNIEDVTKSDPAVVKSIGRLATSAKSPFELKRAAAMALRSIHNEHALPFLATLLDEHESDLQTLTVAGLSAFVQNLPVITPEDLTSMSWMNPVGSQRFGNIAGIARFVNVSGKFRDETDKQAHIQAWKQWWDIIKTELSY